jgi:hypothetical protein
VQLLSGKRSLGYILHWSLAVLPGLILRGCHNSSGSLAIFAAIRRASSLVSSLAAERRPGSSIIAEPAD